MKRYYTTFTLLMILFIGLLLSACKKDDDLIDENDNLFRKSFPVIEIVNIDSSSTGALINFNISKVEPNDRIQKKWIVYWPSDYHLDTMEQEIKPYTNNFGSIAGLTSNTDYKCQIKVMTSDTINFFFYSDSVAFSTPTLTVTVDPEFIEDEQELKVTAIAQIENYAEIKTSLQINQVGFKWVWMVNGNRNEVKTKPAMNSTTISSSGTFQGDLRFLDYTADYTVMAYVDIVGEGEISSMPEEFISPAGDFWVNMEDEDLKSYDDTTGVIVGNGDPFEYANIPPLEGAVSFEWEGFVYMGLGRDAPGSYPVEFYKYDPKINKWYPVGDLGFAGEGRMFSVSFSDNNEDVYVGMGCKNCEGYDGYNGNDNLDKIKEINFLNDFYRFDKMMGMFVNEGVPFPNEDGRFGAYGFSDGNTSYVGGGVEKAVKKGDIELTGSTMENINQLDPGEWHDWNGNDIINHKSDFIYEIKNYPENIACSILLNATPTPDPILFCENCGCKDGNCNDIENLHYVIAIPDSTTKPQEYVITLVGDDNYIYLPEDMASGSDRHIKIPVMITDNNIPSLYTWEDNKDGIMLTSELENAAGNNPNEIDFAEIQYLGNPVWQQDNSQSAVFDITLDIGTIWCDKDNENPEPLIDFDELFYKESPINYTEWNNDFVSDMDTLNEVSYELIVKNELLNFNDPTNPTLSPKRYGVTVLQLDMPYLIAGDSEVPFKGTIPSTHRLFEFNNSWINIPVDNNFENRIHPFSIVIDFANGTRKGYVGGGEELNGEPVNLDLWKLDPSENPKFKEVTGCGVSGLTRGVGFSINGKGYVFGKGEQGERVFWVYIPKR